MEKIIEQEILERLVRLETKLDNYNGLREKLEDVCIISKSMEERVQKLESSYTWLWRTFAGALILGFIASFIKWG